MCGINGFQGSFDPELIKAMNLAIIHRGPDNSSNTTVNDTCLGHVRLSIIDLSDRSNQPITSGCGRYTIVFNGEIYNYKKLKERLLGEGSSFSTDGDAEVLLECWVKMGSECLSILDGIFSFAIYDIETSELVLVRDHFGIKPLYYALTKDGFIFSSEVKGLLQCQSISREINLDAVASVLELLWQPGSDTVLAAVKKVPPGSLIKIKNGIISEQNKYYNFPSYSGSLSKEESISTLKQYVEESVRSQLVADVEVGAFLSGGVDSSIVCAYAKEHSSNFKRVYSIDTDSKNLEEEGFENDLPFAKKVAFDLGLDLSVVEADSKLFELLPKCIFLLDEPQADPAVINAYKICELASEDGTKVLLSGAGGDDFFSGYRRHYATGVDAYLDVLPTSIKCIVSEFSKKINVNKPFFRRVKKYLNGLNRGRNERIAGYFSWLSQDQIRNLLREPKAINWERVGSNVLLDHIKNKKTSNIERMLDLEREYFLTDHNLNYTDKMGMAHGVEVRVPLITKRLAEVAAKIPYKLKQKGRQGKWVLKKAAEDKLSNEIIYRKKTGFGVPLRSWLHGPLQKLINNLLSKESIESRGIFDYNNIRNLIENDLNGSSDNAYSIYALLTLEVWFRQFIDSETPVELSYKDLMKK